MSKQNLSSIKGVLFDKDGTLFDFTRTWLPVVRDAADFAAGGNKDLAQVLLSAGGLDLNENRFLPDSLIAAGYSLELAEFWRDLGAIRPTKVLHQYLDDAFNRLGLANAAPVTDLKTFFGFLKDRGLLLGIATNDSEAGAMATVNEFGLSDLVSFVAGYDSGFGPKPGPGMAQGFCRVTGLQPRAVAVVGDSDHDMVMARLAGAGIRIGVLTGAGTRESLGNSADLVLEDITCLKDLLI
ncbi:HAD family hydrolase [Desulfonatronovibrio hydrogenovorans]|uniref:HAD family hydrolase n=1 Tax=Desulfonatronovibrio hydrogenovorans TaxID=53245 RepID=UPI00048AE1EF|nr:HAD family hydrolase [Desulfonatronovibrio hydrogenovorans]